MKEKMPERIKKCREGISLKQTELAEKIGICDGVTISKWERGLLKPGRDKIIAMSKLFHVTADYLLGLTDDPKMFVQNKNEEYELNEEGEYILTKPTMIKQAIQNMKEYLEVITIPVLSPEQTACCGNGIPFLDITAHNGEAISITFKDVGYTVDEMRPPFAIETQGISMSGWGIQNGSRVVINPAEEVRNMDIALICYHGKLALKKIRYLENGEIDLLSSDGSVIHINKDEMIPELFMIWGKAMSQISRVQHGI